MIINTIIISSIVAACRYKKKHGRWPKWRDIKIGGKKSITTKTDYNINGDAQNVPTLEKPTPKQKWWGR
jgi:hypothetical protein